MLVEEDEKNYFDIKEPKIIKLVNLIAELIKESDHDSSSIVVVAPGYIRRELFELFEQVFAGLKRNIQKRDSNRL
ncbi:MAG: hypothetical protein MZU97_02080 [Bacillus subtilis]|nr:hypothetical protein [Bacillus subtilis]